MTTQLEPHAVLPSGPDQSPQTSLVSQLVREAFAGFSGIPSPGGITGVILQAATPSPAAQPPRADSVSVAASSQPSSPFAGLPASPGVAPYAAVPQTSDFADFHTADPYGIESHALAPTDPAARVPEAATVALPGNAFFPGDYAIPPRNVALPRADHGAVSGYVPVSGYSPAGDEATTARAGAPDGSALDNALNPDNAFAFGEPRFTKGYQDRQNGDSVISQHHARLDSTPNYYFLEQRQAPHSDAVPASVGPGESARAVPARPSSHAPAVETAGNAPRDGVLTTFESRNVSKDFPILRQTVNGHRLVWLDNSAMTQKPQSVIDMTSEFYSRHNSNIHRGAHTLAARATDLFEGARDKLRDFVGASSSREIVFLRGTTEAINLVANSFGQKYIGEGDEILITHIEHHANIVPWQLLASRTGAVIKVAPVDDNGTLLLDRFTELLSPRTRIVSVAHVSNALGSINPVEQIIAISHAVGVPVLIDAAQSAPHLPLDVRALDADFLVLSGYKIFGPSGIGILYAREQWLEALPPWQGGGHMIKDVTFEHTVFNGPPEKFEAGTPDIAGAVGLGAAVDYINSIGIANVAAYEHALLDYANEGLATVPGLRLIGTSPVKAAVISFVVNGFDPDQISRHLDKYGIATRSGHHCAQPALRRFGVESTVRASLALYNTRDDVDTLVNALHLLPRR